MRTTPGRWDLLHRRLPLVAVAAFVGMAVLTSLLAWSVYRNSPHPDLGFLDGPDWLDAWFQGDSGWYHAIAADGYSYTPGQQSSVAFFPAYPLTAHLLGRLMGGDWATAEGVLTLLAAAGLVALFARWVRDRLPARAAVVAVAALLLYPYSFFLYGTGYSDAFFMLTAIGAFALLERRHYVLAGLVGVLATAGRPVGVAVFIGLAVRAVEMIADERARRQDPVRVAVGVGGRPERPPVVEQVADRRSAGRSPVPLRAMWDALPAVRWRELSVLVSLAGLVGWMVYLGTRFGDPVAFFTVQGAPGWEQPGGPATWFKLMFAGAIVKGLWGTVALLVPQALACLVAVLLLPTVWRRFGWGYTAFAVVSLAIPILGTKDFMGSGRYVLAAFPVLAAGAVVLTDARRPRWLLPAALAVMAIGLVLGTIFYVQGVEVS
jgi:hypothetical protein